MFQNKIVKYLAIVTLVLFILGCVLLTIGMVANATYTDATGTYTEKWSVASLIKEWNAEVSLIPDVNIDKANLFNFHSNLITYIDKYESLPAFLTDQSVIDFLHKLLSLANTAIAGFSFIIISIAAAIGTVITGVLLKDKE